MSRSAAATGRTAAVRVVVTFRVTLSGDRHHGIQYAEIQPNRGSAQRLRAGREAVRCQIKSHSLPLSVASQGLTQAEIYD